MHQLSNAVVENHLVYHDTLVAHSIVFLFSIMRLSIIGVIPGIQSRRLIYGVFTTSLARSLLL
jgi:hypothetical protein